MAEQEGQRGRQKGRNEGEGDREGEREVGVDEIHTQRIGTDCGHETVQ